MCDSNSGDLCGVDPNLEGIIENSASSSSASYRLLGHRSTVHQIMGGGKAADVMLWRRRRASIGIVVSATASWLLIEYSGISFLSLCSDVLLILVVLLFLRANYASIMNKQIQTLPGLVLSEEMVNNAAASFRAKVNYTLLMAHDITFGKDFRLFFVVVIALWLLSVIGNLISFATFTYIGIIFSITLPALYDRFESHVDRYAEVIHQKFTKHYKIVDESLHSRLPRPATKDKDS